MRILGIDTSTVTASVALIEDGQLIADAGTAGETQPGVGNLRGNHSETVLPLIQSVLDKAGFRLVDLAAIAIAIGPGSFTGLRIGLALVKGLAYDGDLPVIGVSSLEAQAARAENLAGPICALLDARKHEVYAALFDRQDGKLVRQAPDQVLAVSALASLFDRTDRVRPVALVGAGAERYREELLRLFEGRARFIGEAGAAKAAHAMALLAMTRIGDAAEDNLGRLVPRYLSPCMGLGNTHRIVPNPLK